MSTFLYIKSLQQPHGVGRDAFISQNVKWDLSLLSMKSIQLMNLASLENQE